MRANPAGGAIPLEWERCPHCGRPGPCPNVKAAAAPDQRAALDRRYRAAFDDAAARGVEQELTALEWAVQGSRAVITRPLRDIDRITSSDRELFATFYGLTEGEVRLPFGDRWDRLRRLADEALFPGYKEHIRFAALSLDGIGLTEFGECSLTLSEPMIAHRASVFEDNSASVMERQGYQEPPGWRATWEERSKLCIAKHAAEVAPGTVAAAFPRLLLRPGSASEESRFVEVHIWGPMSIRTVERVILERGGGESRKAFDMALRDRLARLGIEPEEV